MDIQKEIEKITSSFKQLPYLFIGTGLSKRYANAPDWDELLFKVWKEMNPQNDTFEYKLLKQGIERQAINSNDDSISEENIKYIVNPILATKLQNQFNELYYETDFYSKIFNNEENNEIVNNHYDPFKYYISKITRMIKLDEKKSDFSEIEKLVKNQNKIAGIITTNYDYLLENIFTDFSVMIGQDNLLLSHSINIFEIFKIHGCTSSPSSIIITEKDYKTFNDRLKYLSAKLLTIFVEHPIIFIGYGMGDLNIRGIFKEMAKCLNRDQLDNIKDNFIFLSRSKDGKDVIKNIEINFYGLKYPIPMKELILEDYSMVYKALSNIESSLPIKLARKLHDMVCNFVYSSDAKNNIIFGSMDSPDIDDTKTAVYFGKRDDIEKIGFSHFTIDDILEDVLLDTNVALTNEKLITHTMKNIRSCSGNTTLPIYKYISALDFPLEKIPENYKIIKDYDDIKPTNNENKNYIKTDKIYKSIRMIENDFPDHIKKQIVHIKKYASNLECDDLYDYLIKHYKNEHYEKYTSDFRRLICLYDFKKYGKK